MTLDYAMLHSRIFAPKRRTQTRSDFGDTNTVGLHLRMMGKYNTPDLEERVFGIYLGEIDGVFAVGAMATLDFEPTELLEYPTLEQLKQVWELD
jgi:hypothetical protein